MKRIIEIEGEVEKHLIAIFDAAMKSAGFSILQSIDFVRNAIKQALDEKDCKECPKENCSE